MDAETFKKVFIPYHQKLYRIAKRIIEDSATAEDIVQETYIKLWNRRHEMANVENTEAFAIVILRNTCLDFLRKMKHDYQPSYDSEISEKQSLSEQIETQDSVAHVKNIIDNLPEQQRQVIILKHWDDCSDEEIEQVTGLSAGNIRVIISRARKTIREKFIKIEQQ